VRIVLSPSQIATAEDCRFQHWLRSILKVKPAASAANLAFGTCLDIATREYVRAVTLGSTPENPVAHFRRLWQEKRSELMLTYASTQSPESLEKMGVALMELWPSDWAQSGFEVALDQEGHPLIDVPLRVLVGRRGDIELEMYCVLDLVVYTPEAELTIIDCKSAARMHSTLYAHRSAQLTSYQFVMEANRQRLGLPPVQRLGFWDFLKRKKSSRIEPPLLIDPRPNEVIKEFCEKLFWLAEDIARKRFPKSSRMLHNTPCEACDYAQYCVYGDAEGLLFPQSSPSPLQRRPSGS
jgi:hypothetical protein